MVDGSSEPSPSVLDAGSSSPPAADLAGQLVPAITRLVDDGQHPVVVVGIDGRSGSGKSTLSRTLADLLLDLGTTVTLIEGDDFYTGGSATTWDRRSPRQKVDRGMDWRRQRPVLEALRAGRPATFQPFHWDADDWDGEPAPLAPDPIHVEPAAVVLLDGAYSCRPELHDLLDLRVLLEVSRDVRRRQLLEREGEAYRADWEGRWSVAEDLYFGEDMPPTAFDVVLTPT